MFTFYLCVFWIPYEQLCIPTARYVCAPPRTTVAFLGSQRQNISILCILCSWPAPKTRLRSFYMTLLWTVEIYLKMLPMGSMSKALLYSLRMTAANWYLDPSPAVRSSLACSVWKDHTGYTSCSFLTVKVMDSTRR